MSRRITTVNLSALVPAVSMSTLSTSVPPMNESEPPVNAPTEPFFTDEAKVTLEDEKIVVPFLFTSTVVVVEPAVVSRAVIDSMVHVPEGNAISAPTVVARVVTLPHVMSMY